MTLSNLNMERSTLKVYTTIPIEACQHFKLRDLYLVAGLYINAPYKIGVEYMETNTTIEQLARTTGISTDYIKDSFIPKLKNSGYIKVVTTQESYMVKRNKYYLPNPSENYRIIWGELFSDNSLSPEEKGLMIGIYCLCANNTFRIDMPAKTIYEHLGLTKNTYTKYMNNLVLKGVIKSLGESYVALVDFNHLHGLVLMYPYLGFQTYLDILLNHEPTEEEIETFKALYQSA